MSESLIIFVTFVLSVLFAGALVVVCGLGRRRDWGRVEQEGERRLEIPTLDEKGVVTYDAEIVSYYDDAA